MKALAIIGAIVFAWISGVGAPEDGNKPAVFGALIFLALSILCGVWAWRI